MTAGRRGRPPGPDADTILRLEEWARLAPRGRPVAEIAAAIGMTRAALDQMVCRARRRGDPLAVYHPLAVLPGQGTWQLTGRAGPRRARAKRESGSQTA
ncbi:hypothetical protein GCM10010170_003140 [Dactylosporangium salmoneum]|uniref:MarR family transcriptional regulator n=1 Tax=Dactylosporangium salmoneum TaxID=53361 RepID=A0ABN3FDK2_9ACTN